MKNCKFLCWNVWSILSQHKLILFIDFLNENGIDIACVCETWFYASNGIFTSIIRDAGYDIHHAYREDKSGGGVAIIFKPTLRILFHSASTVKFVSFEFCSVIIRLSHIERVLLLCIYRRQEVATELFLRN